MSLRHLSITADELQRSPEAGTLRPGQDVPTTVDARAGHRSAVPSMRGPRPAAGATRRLDPVSGAVAA